MGLRLDRILNFWSGGRIFGSAFFLFVFLGVVFCGRVFVAGFLWQGFCGVLGVARGYRNSVDSHWDGRASCSTLSIHIGMVEPLTRLCRFSLGW